MTLSVRISTTPRQIANSRKQGEIKVQNRKNGRNVLHSVKKILTGKETKTYFCRRKTHKVMLQNQSGQKLTEVSKKIRT